MKHSLFFFTSYNQFYICDKSNICDTGSNSFWTDEAFKDKLAIGKGVLGVGIGNYDNVKLEIYLLKKENKNINLDDYDHIVEGSLIIKSGIIQILDCPNNSIELEIKTKPDTYRVRIYSSNLDSVTEDDGNDYYKVEIWQDSITERKVIKQYIY